MSKLMISRCGRGFWLDWNGWGVHPGVRSGQKHLLITLGPWELSLMRWGRPLAEDVVEDKHEFEHHCTPMCKDCQGWL